MTESPNECPTCGEGYRRECPCGRGHRECALGHSWSVCQEHGKVVVGEPDHNRPVTECSCPGEESVDADTQEP